MSTLRKQAISIIDDIPDESMAYFLQLMIAAQNLVNSNKVTTRHEKVFARLDKLAANEKTLAEENSEICHNRAVQSSAIMDQLNELFKHDQGWISEEDMLDEFNRERRKHRSV